MTPEEIAQAELDMAAETIAEGDYHERHVVAATIRAIAPADVLAKVGDERCTKCGHPRSNHPYRHPFVSMGNDLLSTQAAPNAVARLVNALESGKSFAESWIEENGGIDGCDYQDRVSYENICAVLAACKGVRDE